MALVAISRAGRDAHKHVLVLCRCSCGREVTIRKDKVAHQQTCGDCREVPVPALVAERPPLDCAPAPQLAPLEAAPERTPIYLLGEIAARDAAVQKLDEQIADLSRLLAKEGVLPVGLDGDSAAKLFREVVTTANVLRKEKQRLEKELRDLSGQKAVTLNSAESVLARARNMRGAK